LPWYAVTAVLPQTAPGWPAVSWQIAAVNALAEPSMACAIGLDGSASAAAMSLADFPASSCGLMLAPELRNLLPKSMNGIDPAERAAT
jgi:hypothetical protein